MKYKIAVLSFIMLAACGGESIKTIDPTPVDDSVREKWRAYGAECAASGQSYESCVKMCEDEIAAQMPEEVLAGTTFKEGIACRAGARKTIPQ